MLPQQIALTLKVNKPRQGFHGILTGRGKLEVQEIVGSRQVSESHRIHALSHHIGKVLEDGGQLQGGRRFAQFQPVARNQSSEDQLEVKNQKTLFIAIALIDVGSILEKVGERQEITFQRQQSAVGIPWESQNPRWLSEPMGTPDD